MNNKAWLQGILTAFITAFSTAAIGVLALPTVFNGSRDGLFNILKMTLVPALISVFTFLKQSPLPTSSTTTTVSVSQGTTAGPLACIAFLLLFPVLLLSGCSDWERTTFQTLSASKAVEDSAQTSYEARTIPHNQCVYDVITKAKAAQTVAVDAMMTYETVKSSTGATAAQNAVNSALANLAPIIASMQTLGTSTCATTSMLEFNHNAMDTLYPNEGWVVTVPYVTHSTGIIGGSK